MHGLLAVSTRRGCSESATLDFVAVLGGVEVLHHLLVFLGDVGLGEPAGRELDGEQIPAWLGRLSWWVG